MRPAPFRFLLYCTMALMDCVSGIFVFIGPVRATILGYDPLVAGSMVTARAVCICLSTFIISRWLNSRNALKFLFFGNVMYFAAAILGIWATNLFMLYLTSSLAGVFMPIFSSSFQVLMKDIDSTDERPLPIVVGTYTFAWCVGMGFGPFITGGLMHIGDPPGGGPGVGWLYAYLAAAAMILTTFVIMLWVRSVAGRQPAGGRLPARPAGMDNPERSEAPPEPAEPAQEKTESGNEGNDAPDLAWLGWTMAVVGCVILGIVRAVFPAGATAAGMPEWRSGLIMMLLSVCMGVFALWFSHGQGWMNSGRAILAVGLLGAAGMGLYVLPMLMGWSLLDHIGQFYLAATLAGCYSGVVYLYSAFHSLAHPLRAGRNIALNEFMLAFGMTVGTLGGGWLAKRYGFYPPFAVGAALAAALAAFQWWAHGRAGRARGTGTDSRSLL